jgi:hypothetical protein
LRARIDGLPVPRSVPFVDLRLQSVPFPQQRAIDGAEAIKKAIEPLPKRHRFDTEAGQHFINDEIVKNLSHLEIGNSNALNVRHSTICPLMVLRFEAGSHFYTIVARNINTSAASLLRASGLARRGIGKACSDGQYLTDWPTEGNLLRR